MSQGDIVISKQLTFPEGDVVVETDNTYIVALACGATILLIWIFERYQNGHS